MEQKIIILNVLSVILSIIILLPVFSYALTLDNVQYDPAVIGAGDTVDIVIQYHDELSTIKNYKIGDPSYTFNVKLIPNDDLTKKYVLMIDSEGDNYKGSILTGGHYNKLFRVKISSNAPAANYQFKLIGQWYHNGKKVGAVEQEKILMRVKKEGIIIGLANIVTVPSEVRPGDNYVQIKTSIENSGHKDAKAIELRLLLPKGFKSSYSDNNRVWLGSLEAGKNKEVVFTINLDKEVKEGLYDFVYNISYMDLDDNSYQKNITVPFYVRERPYLEVSRYNGSGIAGGKGKLEIWVKNTGEESAEAVDVRIIKESGQPFDFDVRSQYVGDIDPGEEGLAIFDIDANNDAELKSHDFKVVIRSKGDSDIDDNNIYTFNRQAKYVITGNRPNYFLYVGSGLILLLLIVIIIKFVGRKK